MGLKTKKLNTLTANQFAYLVGIDEGDVPEECIEILSEDNFDYEILQGQQRDSLMLEVVRKIDSGKMNIAGKEKQQVWETGWSENLDNFVESNYQESELMPKYYRPSQPFRIDRQYARGEDPYYEYNFFRLLRGYISDRYLRDVDSIYEFGCGPGHNLLYFSRRFPEAKLHGLDWAQAAVNLVNKIGQVQGLNLTGYRFDMFDPNYDITIDPNSAMITMGALEQLGDNYKLFLEYLLKESPAICVNIEPLCELYDENNLIDYLAIRHHKQRNLLGNYIGSLKDLELEAKIEVLKIQRVLFGGLFVDGWSYVVWKPI